MGVGYPLDIVICVALGVDMFLGSCEFLDTLSDSMLLLQRLSLKWLKGSTVCTRAGQHDSGPHSCGVASFEPGRHLQHLQHLQPSAFSSKSESP